MELTIYLATDRGVIQGAFSPERWEIVGQALPDHAVTCVVATGTNVLAGTREGIYRSSDLGKSWTAANMGLKDHHVRWLAIHPEDEKLVMAGFEPAALYVSEDGGGNWQERPEVAALRDQFKWMLPYSPESGCIRGFDVQEARAYAAVEVGGLLRSNDWGQTWSLVPASDGIPTFGPPGEGMVHPDVHSVIGHPSSVDLIFTPTGGGFYVSEDGGESFSRRYPPCYCRAVWVDPADETHLVLGPADGVDRNGRIMETKNGGESWEPIESGLDAPWPRTMVERFYEHEDILLALLSDGRLFFSEIGDWKWNQIFHEAPGIHALAIQDSQ